MENALPRRRLSQAAAAGAGERAIPPSAMCAAPAFTSAWNWCESTVAGAGAAAARHQRAARSPGADRRRRAHRQRAQDSSAAVFLAPHADQLLAALDGALAERAASVHGVSGEYTPEVVADLHRMVARALPRWGLSAATAISAAEPVGECDLRAQRSGGARGAGAARASRRLFIGRGDPLGARLDQALRRDGVVETAHAGGGQRWRAGADASCRRRARPRAMRSRSSGCRARSRIPPAMPRAGSSGSASSPRRCTGMRALGVWPAGFRRKRWDLDAMVGPHGCLGILARGHRSRRRAGPRCSSRRSR